MQVELGDRLGVRQATVNRWLNEEAVPEGEHYRAIRRLLRIDGPTFAAALVASNGPSGMERRERLRRRRGR